MSVTIRKIQIKIMMRCYLTEVRTEVTKAVKDVKKRNATHMSKDINSQYSAIRTLK